MDYAPDQIVVSNGAKQSIANVFQAIINEGDEVVVSPFWVSYSALIELAGGIPVYIKGVIADNFKATAAQLMRLLLTKLRLSFFPLLVIQQVRYLQKKVRSYSQSGH